jgi:exodeoxyribonuclease-1
MAASFFFYDLETSGFNPRKARIMQFAGQRTDMDLNPIGEPVNVLIKMTPDILPDPDAVLITGITPQQTISDGITEAEFLKFFYEEVVKPDTIFVGFNSIRFDDEFMRFLHYRNFYDPYGWHWKDSCSRWDLLDVARMTRALRPDGIKWPFASDGRPSNRLEYLASVNGLDHLKAHDALSDVHATIAVAKLLKTKQPDIFDYLLSARSRKVVGALVLKNEPFIYTTGKYSSEYLHTSVATLLAKHDSQDAALVYDLRFDPRPFMEMEVDKLVEAWRYSKDPAAQRLPVKTLKYNRSPAVAPLGVIKERADQDRLKLSLDTVKEHLAYLRAGQPGFVQKVQQAVKILDNERSGAATELIDNSLTVDERLYDSFIPNGDAALMSDVRAAQPEQLSQFVEKFKDSRLKTLLPLYKARNYPSNLTSEERAEWDKFCQLKLLSGEKDSLLAKYFIRIQALNSENTTGEKHYLLEELQLYGESIMPIDLTA